MATNINPKHANQSASPSSSFPSPSPTATTSTTTVVTRSQRRRALATTSTSANTITRTPTLQREKTVDTKAKTLERQQKQQQWNRGHHNQQHNKIMNKNIKPNFCRSANNINSSQSPFENGSGCFSDSDSTDSEQALHDELELDEFMQCSQESSGCLKYPKLRTLQKQLSRDFL